MELNFKRVATFLAISLNSFPLTAQNLQGGLVEVGAFGTFTKFDATGVTLSQDFGAGSSIGLFLNSTFSLEGFGSYSYPKISGTANDQVEVGTYGGTLLANLKYGVGSFFLGAGYERVAYRGALQGDENGFHGIIGNRFSLGGRATLRVQGTAVYFPSSTLVPGQSSALNFGGSAGFSIFAFGGQPRDSDGDGIVDRLDQCSATPAAASIDEVGCPSDSDSDGVLDGIDMCADTPDGAITNSTGCPSDPDGDGVFVGIDICPDTPSGARVDVNGCSMDSDGDLVVDGIDACADTPQGAVIDATGCPTDMDTDGIFDGLDRCPGTQPGVTVDAVGCPSDTDGDGVLDDADACPATPTGSEIDARGCRIVVDTDGDGVEDQLDRCPNTPNGRTVDVNGCPVLFEVTQGEARAQPLILEGVTFRTGSAELTQTSFSVLDQVAVSLIANPTVRIEIVGHTDNTGSRGGNITISMRRADSVRSFLMNKGISAERLVSQGAGPDAPIATNATAEGRARNRRVELRLIQR